MTEKTFADFRCDQMVALYYLQLREERFQRDKEIKLRKLKNKVRTMPEFDLQGFVSEADKGFKPERKSKRKKRSKYMTDWQLKVKKLRDSGGTHWPGLQSFNWVV